MSASDLWTLDENGHFIPPGYTSREEWLEDIHAEYLARLTAWQRLDRWWRMNWLAVLTVVILLGFTVALCWVAYG